MSRAQNMILSACNFVVFCSIAWANSGFLGSKFLYWTSVVLAVVCVALFVVAATRRAGE